ncbi:unnamed protein product [Pieris macdunnoughi]|uniref:Uncharacterized protein n=1 Tax=Pieris macdunnoughi TaxID=345717 RepID=A0A821VD70_9NEOP|nr:unnamed protein product [Pieris macdunnoughi]
MHMTGKIIILFITFVGCEKVFKSVPVVVKTYENDTVLLPCYIDDSEAKLRVRWHKNKELLGDSEVPHHLMPPRTRMYSNFSLQIEQLNEKDTADYTCEVIRQEPWGPIRQTHTVEVQYSPSIKTIPEEGFVEVRKGDYVDIGCETTGTPQPIVDWSKNILNNKNNTVALQPLLLLGELMAADSPDVILCSTPFISCQSNRRIRNAPVVTTDRSFVHTAVGLRAVLTAKLEFAVPPAKTTWFRDGRTVKLDDRVVMMVQDNLHQLIFRTVRKSDLGNFTFRAENKLGMADVSFKLTGVPNVASFKVDSSLNKPTPVTYTLFWEVDSYSSIIEYNLWLRPYYGRLSTTEPDAFTTNAPANLWSKIVVPGDSSDGPIHSASYMVRGLTPSTVYEAIVTSRNRFGWSKPSATLHFATEPGFGRTLPSYEETDITPTLEEPQKEEAFNKQKRTFLKDSIRQTQRAIVLPPFY